MIEKLVDLMTTGKFRLAVEKVIVRLKIFMATFCMLAFDWV